MVLNLLCAKTELHGSSALTREFTGQTAQSKQWKTGVGEDLGTRPVLCASCVCVLCPCSHACAHILSMCVSTWYICLRTCVCTNFFVYLSVCVHMCLSGLHLEILLRRGKSWVIWGVTIQLDMLAHQVLCPEPTHERRGSADFWLIPQASWTLITFQKSFPPLITLQKM